MRFTLGGQGLGRFLLARPNEEPRHCDALQAPRRVHGRLFFLFFRLSLIFRILSSARGQDTGRGRSPTNTGALNTAPLLFYTTRGGSRHSAGGATSQRKESMWQQVSTRCHQTVARVWQLPFSKRTSFQSIMATTCRVSLFFSSTCALMAEPRESEWDTPLEND